jgi:hypothetical protein
VTLQSSLISLFVYGFPLVIILIQWVFIRRKLPWVGMLIGLILVVAVYVKEIYFGLPTPEQCQPPASCDMLGVGIVLITFYAIGVALTTSFAGFIILRTFRKRVWQHGEAVAQTMKIPYLILASIVLLYSAWVLGLYRVIPLQTDVRYGPYP